MDGTKKIKLEVAKSNKGATNLYEQLGFKSVKLFKDYYGRNNHAIQMELKVDQLSIKQID